MIQVVSVLVGFSMLFAILVFIYKGKLKKEYSIVWLGLSVAILIFSFWRDGIGIIATWVGVYYAPAFLFMIAFFIMLIMLIHLSLVISKLKNQVKELSQKMALLEEK